MSRLPSIIFHKFKDSSNLDVALINSIVYRRRLFCFFDRDKPYQLDIDYNSPKDDVELTITTGGQLVCYDKHVSSQLITLRYENILQCEDEINAVNEKKKRLDHLSKRLKCFYLKLMADDEN